MQSIPEDKPAAKPAASPEKPDRRRLSAEIGKHVIHTLGQPGELYRVQVRQLWDNNFRVNVFIGADTNSFRLAHSYFLVADGDGNIVNSTPEITRQYL
jgi:hypothetical protein